MILNKPQAEAAYSAMCALNNVNARIVALIPLGGGISARVREMPGGVVIVSTEYRGEPSSTHNSLEEKYGTQSDFATAYSLTQG